MGIRLKLIHLITLCCISLLFSCGYKQDNVEIQEKIYKALKVYIQEEYNLIDSGEDSALGDFRQYFTIKFSESSYMNFIEKIDLSMWVNVGSEGKIYQYTYQRNDREIYRLYLSMIEKSLRHEYIKE